MIHIPVLLQEVIEVLQVRPGEEVIDGTLGSGGHASELIKRIAPGGVFVGVDRDENSIRNFKNSEITVQTFVLQANYAQLPEVLKKLGLPKADALLLDLGFSSDQLSSGSFAGRGFSFLGNEPLIMTYEADAEPLKDQLKKLSEAELRNILREFGEEAFSVKIAASIKEQVKAKAMNTTKDLVSAVLSAVPPRYKSGPIHPATRTFQALRIFANHELEHLETVLKNLYEIVRVGGRVAVISFHSLEDRIVKNYFRDYSRGHRHSADISGELPNTGDREAKLITKKPITAGEDELRLNPRARSAKLRALEL